MSDSAPTEISAIVLLCDSAQSIGGKLFILGGGWTQALVPQGNVFPMAVAVKITVPWTETNRQIPFRTYLIDSDGDPVSIGGNVIDQTAAFELGRPPGLDPGTPLDAMFALNLGNVTLPPGNYAWRVEVDGEVRARAPFRVIDPTQPQGGRS